MIAREPAGISTECSSVWIFHRFKLADVPPIVLYLHVISLLHVTFDIERLIEE